MKFELFDKEFFKFVKKVVDGQFRIGVLSKNKNYVIEKVILTMVCDDQIISDINYFCGFTKTVSDSFGLYVGYLGQNTMYHIFRMGCVCRFNTPYLDIQFLGNKTYSIQIVY